MAQQTPSDFVYVYCVRFRFGQVINGTRYSKADADSVAAALKADGHELLWFYRYRRDGVAATQEGKEG